MMLAKMKSIALRVSEHTWRYHEMGKEANTTMERVGIVSGQHVFVSGSLIETDSKAKIKFCVASPETVSILVDMVNFWHEVAVRINVKSREADAWIYQDAMKDWEKLEKKIEYMAERIEL